MIASKLPTHFAIAAVVIAANLATIGCGGDSASSGGATAANPAAEANAAVPQVAQPADRQAEQKSALKTQTSSLPVANADRGNAPTSSGNSRPPLADKQPGEQKRSLSDLLLDKDDKDPFVSGRTFGEAGPPVIDEERAAAVGIRKLTGKHLTLYTDLPPAPEVDELPQVFDLAVPQWCEYFDVDYATLAEWRLNGYVMQDEAKFRRGGLLPDNMPQFMYGIQRDYEFWVREQPSAYYRRHLLLHEGTHGFMNVLLGGSGPPWYAEGIAELLATHQWQDGRLAMRYFPQDKEETPLWGRIKLVQDEFAAQRGKRFREIMHYERTAHLAKAPYGWCWAAAAFLDNHPKYQARFRDLRRYVRESAERFNAALEDSIGDDWPALDREWVLLVINIDYGYDIAREAIEEVENVQPVEPVGATAVVQVDRGWQSSGYRVEAGVEYELSADGRFQVDDEPQTWWSEPQGVTIRYHRGRPLGILLGAVDHLDDSANRITPLASPFAVGRALRFTPPESGALYLRINDSPAELDDNAGEVTVRIAPRSN